MTEQKQLPDRADLGVYMQWLQRADGKTILSDQAFLMLMGAADEPEFEQRREMLRYEADRRFHFPLEQVDVWLQETGERYRADPETFEAAAKEAAADPAPGTVLLTLSARELQEMDLGELRFLVSDLLPQGLALLVSPPKYGKSWLVLDLCLCVSSGRPFLGHKTERTGCLYLALEDSERRLKGRMNAILRGAPAPDGFEFATHAGDLSGSLIDQMENFLKTKPNTGLIVIDTFQKVRGPTSGKESAYQTDYREIGLLKAFADKHGIALLLVHHLRKMADDGDVFARISGTNGILGAADTALVLSRKNRADIDTVLSITGRDVEASDSVIRFDKSYCRWQSVGSVDVIEHQKEIDEYRKNPIVKTVHKLLETNGSWSGTASDLLNAGRYITRTELANSARGLTSPLKKLSKQMLEIDGIQYERDPNGSGGGRHTFRYLTADLPEFEELPQETLSPFDTNC